MSPWLVAVIVLVAFVAGWFLCTWAWESAIKRRGMDPDDFRRNLF